jgi:hypothetical protein
MAGSTSLATVKICKSQLQFSVLQFMLGFSAPHLMKVLVTVSFGSQTHITPTKQWWSLHVEVLPVK